MWWKLASLFLMMGFCARDFADIKTSLRRVFLLFRARICGPFLFKAHGNHHRYGSLLNQPDGPAPLYSHSTPLTRR